MPLSFVYFSVKCVRFQCAVAIKSQVYVLNSRSSSSTNDNNFLLGCDSLQFASVLLLLARLYKEHCVLQIKPWFKLDAYSRGSFVYISFEREWIFASQDDEACQHLRNIKRPIQWDLIAPLHLTNILCEMLLFIASAKLFTRQTSLRMYEFYLAGTGVQLI